MIQVDERVQILNDSNRGNSIYAKEIQNSPQSFRKGVTGETIKVRKELDENEVTQSLKQLLATGIKSIAVCLLHAYTFPEHEKIIGAIAEKLGFTHISLSHALSPMVKYVPRGQTTCVDAYLTPLIRTYIQSFVSGFEQSSVKNVAISFMMSDGGLCDVDQFSGFKSILSGPAGGVVGYAQTTWNPQEKQPVIGFDMGGTSTDVSRFDGHYDHVFDTEINGKIKFHFVGFWKLKQITIRHHHSSTTA